MREKSQEFLCKHPSTQSQWLSHFRDGCLDAVNLEILTSTVHPVPGRFHRTLAADSIPHRSCQGEYRRHDAQREQSVGVGILGGGGASLKNRTRKGKVPVFELLEDRTVLSVGPQTHLGLRAADNAALDIAKDHAGIVLGAGDATSTHVSNTSEIREARMQSRFAARAERNQRLAARHHMAVGARSSSSPAEVPIESHLAKAVGHARRLRGRLAPRLRPPVDQVISTPPAAVSESNSIASGSAAALTMSDMDCPTFEITSVDVSPRHGLRRRQRHVHGAEQRRMGELHLDCHRCQRPNLQHDNLVERAAVQLR